MTTLLVICHSFFLSLLLAVGLLGFHLGAPNAPGEAEADVAAFGGRFADGGVVGIEATSTGADGAEHIGHVEEQRQATVEEVGTHAARSTCSLLTKISMLSCISFQVTPILTAKCR